MSKAREAKQALFQVADLPLPEDLQVLDADEAERVWGGESLSVLPALGLTAGGTGRSGSGMIGDTRTIISAEAA